jgi:hypothetical protein
MVAQSVGTSYSNRLEKQNRYSWFAFCFLPVIPAFLSGFVLVLNCIIFLVGGAHPTIKCNGHKKIYWNYTSQNVNM